MPPFSAGAGLANGARARLQASWAEWFRREVTPELLAVEERFAGLYTEYGRPNWSVARLLGLCLLQHLYDLSDQQALDALSFDVRWQRALDLDAEQAYLSRRSLVEFCRRLVSGRLSLARETLRIFVRSLDDAQRAELPEAVRAWYDAEDSWEQQET